MVEENEENEVEFTKHVLVLIQSIKKIFIAISADTFVVNYLKKLTCEICVIALFCDEKRSNSFYVN